MDELRALAAEEASEAHREPWVEPGPARHHPERDAEPIELGREDAGLVEGAHDRGVARSIQVGEQLEDDALEPADVEAEDHVNDLHHRERWMRRPAP
jgi:hypothetical protein